MSPFIVEEKKSLNMKFHIFATFCFFVAAIFVADAYVLSKEAGEGHKEGEKIRYLPPPGTPCHSTSDCPPGQICVFPWPEEGIGKCE